MQFRKDINALRALALIGVLLYHFYPNFMPGGFSGVDVFFVISGYLMTGIILKGIENNQFKLINFYRARAKRIIPALVVVCFFSLVLGRLILPPTYFDTLGKHVYSSLVFISNVQYAKESGYFDIIATEKWLLHTWSLSVEWQFYLIYPVLLIILDRLMNRKNLEKTLLFLIVFLFISGCFLSIIEPEKSYFSFFARSWELLLGGIAYIYPLNIQKISNKTVQSMGIIFILCSYFLMNSLMSWPGYYALLPTLGAFLVLVSKSETGYMQENPLLQYIGTRSYSIYLWHWLILVIFLYLGLDSLIELGFGIFLSLFLGHLSYQMIEAKKYKITRELAVKNKFYTNIWFWLFWCVGLTGLLVSKTDGMLNTYPKHIQIIANESKNRNPRLNECHSAPMQSSCQYGIGEVGAIVIGDSHATGYVNTISRAMTDKSTLEWTQSSCVTIQGVKTRASELQPWNDSCGKRMDAVFMDIKQYPGVPIFMINRTSAVIEGVNEVDRKHLLNQHTVDVNGTPFNQRSDEWKQSIADGLYQTACKLSKHNPIIMISDTPEFKENVPLTMAKQLMLGDAERFTITRKEYEERTRISTKAKKKAVKDCGVVMLDLTDLWCDKNFCYADKKGRPMYYDDDHLSEFGANQAFDKIQSLLN